MQCSVKGGQTGCLTDHDCINTAGCDIVNGIGTCVEYFSIAAGTLLNNCDSSQQVSMLCSSGYCQDSACLILRGPVWMLLLAVALFLCTTLRTVISCLYISRYDFVLLHILSLSLILN